MDPFGKNPDLGAEIIKLSGSSCIPMVWFRANSLIERSSSPDNRWSYLFLMHWVARMLFSVQDISTDSHIGSTPDGIRKVKHGCINRFQLDYFYSTILASRCMENIPPQHGHLSGRTYSESIHHWRRAISVRQQQISWVSRDNAYWKALLPSGMESGTLW